MCLSDLVRSPTHAEMISQPQKESAYDMGRNHEGHSLLADVYEQAQTRIYFEMLLFSFILQTPEMLPILRPQHISINYS